MTKAARKQASETGEGRTVYGEVDSKADIHKIFLAIREDVETAESRPALTELYKRAGYMITLTYAPSWESKFGKKAKSLRKKSEEEFGITARKINRRAGKIGAEADYDETWGEE